MKPALTITLVVLLICLSIFTSYEHVVNQKLAAENTRLRDELTSQASQLQILQSERQQLGRRLNETEIRIAELEKRIAFLEQETQELRERLRRESYITIGLTFVWNPDVKIQREDIAAVVERMNEVIWDEFQVYFFVYHAEPAPFLPRADSCSNYYVTGQELGIGWAHAAWNTYPERDIPIGVFSNLDHNEFWGCQMSSTNEYAVALYSDALADTRDASQLLSHELLHVFGFTEYEIEEQMGYYVDTIPSAWLPRIQAQAEWFQMTPTSPA